MMRTRRSWKELKKPKSTKQRLSHTIIEVDVKKINAIKEINRLEEEIKKLELKLDKNKREQTMMSSRLQAYKDKLEIMKDRWKK